MARPTDRNRSRKDAEDRYPIKIDLRTPGRGERWPFAEMLQWCRDNVAAGAWQQYSFMDRTRVDEQGIPIDYTRWYFMSEVDAEAFRKRWMAPEKPAGGASYFPTNERATISPKTTAV